MCPHWRSHPLAVSLTSRPSFQPLNVVIAGAPGAGKGTQCEKIVAQFGLVHLSTGDIIRANIKRNSALGKEFLSYTKRGALVPDELVLTLVADAVAGNPDCKTKGWLLDGFPRTKAQADAMPKMGLIADLFLVIDVPDSVLEERICNRRTDKKTGIIYNLKFKPPPADVLAEDARAPGCRLEHRKDDTREALFNRLKEFHANMDEVSSCYRQITTLVDGTQQFAAVTHSVLDACARANNDKPSGPLTLGQRYDKALRKLPILTKFATGVVLGSLSNIISQIIESRPLQASQAVSFALVTGPPFSHWWFPFVAKMVPDTSKFLGLPVFIQRMLMDQAIYGPGITLYMYTAIGLFMGDTPAQIMAALRSEYMSTVLNSWKVWPLASMACFGLVPDHYQSLFINLVGFCWDIYMSIATARARRAAQALK